MYRPIVKLNQNNYIFYSTNKKSFEPKHICGFKASLTYASEGALKRADENSTVIFFLQPFL